MKNTKSIPISRKSNQFNPDREFISNAINHYLRSGGIIKRLPMDQRRDPLMIGLITPGATAFDSDDTVYNR